MTVSVSQVTVADSATEIVAAVDAPTEVLINDPSGGASVFLGEDTNVTTSNGFEIKADSVPTFHLWPGDALYGIVSTGTQAISVITSSAG